MPSCYDKDFYHRITCIVSYSGSTADLFLNYAVLFINICACWNIHQRQSGDTVRRQRQRQRDYQSLNRQQQQQQQGRSSPTDGTGRQVAAAAAAAAATNMTKSQAALASLLFVVVFQVTLCLVLGCTGISIVWCACMPWLFLERNDSRSNNNNNTTTVILMLDVSVILYYAVVAPLITTVAHMCAIILGLVLWIFSSFLTTTPTNVQNLRESM